MHNIWGQGSRCGLLRGRAASFLRNRGGANAVEFSLVALPLIFLILAVVELGLIFVMSLNLSKAMTRLRGKTSSETFFR
jgi:Flp pilus assembly protein TadG